MIKAAKPNTLLLADFIIAGLARYQNAWKNFFALLNTMNLGIGGDRVENVFWRAISLLLPSSVQNIEVQWETKNLSTESPRDIADCIFYESTIFWEKVQHCEYHHM